MTPFGEKIREYRKKKKISLKSMAADLGVSSAYFSALEHGWRGKPGSGLVQQLCGYFGLIWDEAESLKRLAELSHPKKTINTAGLSSKATLLANLLSEKIDTLDEETIDWMIAEIQSTHALINASYLDKFHA